MRLARKFWVIAFVVALAAFSTLLAAGWVQGSHGASVTLKNKATGSTAWVSTNSALPNANVVQVIINDSARNTDANTTEGFSVALQNSALGSSVTVTAAEVNPVTVCGLSSGTPQPPNSPCFLAEVALVSANPGTGQIVAMHGQTLRLEYVSPATPAHPLVTLTIAADNAKPSMAAVSPTNGATLELQQGQNVVFSGEVTDSHSGFPAQAAALTSDHLKLEVFAQDGTAAVNTFGPSQMSLTAVTGGWRFSVATPLATGQFQWQITAMDNAGNQVKSDADPATQGDQRFRLSVQSSVPMPKDRLAARELFALFTHLNDLVKAQTTLQLDGQMVTFSAVAGTVSAKANNTLTVQPRDGSSTFNLPMAEGTPILKGGERITLADVQANDRVIVLREGDTFRTLLVAPFPRAAGRPPFDRPVGRPRDGLDQPLTINGNNNITIVITGDNNKIELEGNGRIKMHETGRQHPVVDDRGKNNVVIFDNDDDDDRDDNHRGKRGKERGKKHRD